MSSITILFAISAIIFCSPYIAKFSKIPITPTEILLGTLMSSFSLLPQNEFFKIVADVGFYYLMFLAGTEVDLKIFITTDRKIVKKSIFFIFLLYIFATIFTFSLDLGKIFIVTIPLMSVGLLAGLYKEYGKNENWLNLAMIVGVIGEVVSIAVLTIAGAYLKGGFNMHFLIHIASLAGFLFSSVIVFKGLEILFWWYPNIKNILMPHYDNNEKDIRLAMALFCFVIAIMLILDLEVVIGAFIAGTFIPTFFDHKKDLPHKLSSFGFGFLIPVFFVYVGSTIDIKAIFDKGVIPTMLNLTIFMILARVIASFIFKDILNKKQCMLFALSLCMPLTLVIATATIAYNSGNITKQYYDAFVLASILETIISMILIKILKQKEITK